MQHPKSRPQVCVCNILSNRAHRCVCNILSRVKDGTASQRMCVCVHVRPRKPSQPCALTLTATLTTSNLNHHNFNPDPLPTSTLTPTLTASNLTPGLKALVGLRTEGAPGPGVAPGRCSPAWPPA